MRLVIALSYKVLRLKILSKIARYKGMLCFKNSIVEYKQYQ